MREGGWASGGGAAATAAHVLVGWGWEKEKHEMIADKQ